MPRPVAGKMLLPKIKAANFQGDHLPRAIFARLLAVGLMATMSALAKLAKTDGAHFSEILFFRQAIGVPLIFGVVALGPGLSTLRTGRLRSHVVRATIGLGSIASWIWAVTLLPLAEASAIQFSVPIAATVFGAILLREHLDWQRWLAVLAGFVGVLFVAQPAAAHFGGQGVAVGCVNVVFAGLVTVVLRRIGRTEPPLTTVFWFVALTSAPLSIGFAIDHTSHPIVVWAELVGVGITGSLGQLAITTSLRFGRIALVMPIDYATLLCATLYGWFLFDTLPSGRTWIGASIIVASSLYPLWRERRGPAFCQPATSISSD